MSGKSLQASNNFIYVDLAADAVIALAKFIAAAVTQSSAMLAEGIHSSIDAINALLLLRGVGHSRKPADADHPFGHGRETYFWSLMVAIITFGVGGGVALVEGVTRLRHAEPIRSVGWNYAVLAISGVFGAVSTIASLRRFSRERRENETVWATFRRSKDPSVFTLLFENCAELLGVLLAFIGVFVGHHWNRTWADPVATIAIAGLLAVVSFLVVQETKGLLVGESADRAMIQPIKELVEKNPNVEKVEVPLTMQLGSHEVLLNMAVRFRRGITISELEKTIDGIEKTIRENFPDVKRIFLEAESLAREGQPENGPIPRVA